MTLFKYLLTEFLQDTTSEDEEGRLGLDSRKGNRDDDAL